MWEASLRWSPVIPACWYSGSSVITSSWVLARSGNMPLMGRYGKNNGVSIPKRGYKRLWFLPCTLPGSSSLLTFMKPTFMLWVALWRGPHDKELRAASSQCLQGIETLSPTTHKEMNPTNNHGSNLEVAPPQSSLEMTAASDSTLMAAAWETLSQITQLNCIHTVDPQKLRDNKCCGFKPPNFLDNLLHSKK